MVKSDSIIGEKIMGLAQKNDAQVYWQNGLSLMTSVFTSTVYRMSKAAVIVPIQHDQTYTSWVIKVPQDYASCIQATLLFTIQCGCFTVHY